MKKCIQLIAGVLVLLFLGVAYAWSLFVAPLEAEFGWTRDKTSLIFTISIICFCAGGMLGGILCSRIGYRRSLLLTAAVLALGFIGCARVQALWQIYLFYGVFCGLGIGITYNVVISTVNKWFSNKIGFSSGVMMMGYGIGSFVLGSLVSYTNGLIGWRGTYYFLAILFGLLITTVAFVLAPAKPENRSDAKMIPLQGQLSPQKLFHTKTFYAYYFWGVSISAVGLAIIGHASLIAAYLGANSYLIVLATGVLSIANGSSRVIFGLLYDKTGRKMTMICISSSLCIGVALINLALMLHSLAILFLAYGFIGFAYGGTGPCNSAFAKEYYGDVNYGKNFSIMTSTGVLASLAGPYVLGLIMSATNSYAKACPFFLLFVFTAFVLQYLLTQYSKICHLKRNHALGR